MVLLATIFDPKKDYSGWFLSEKLDGYRAIWNSKHFVSRKGNIFHVPKQITDTLPKDVILDGELYISREKFNDCSILKKKNISYKEFTSKKIKFHVFDIISSPKKFKDKISFIKKICYQHDFFVFVKQIPMKSNSQIKSVFNTLIKKGAEGIMLRDPESVYENKRSHSLVKLKAFQDDEAIIIGYNISTSKTYTGQLKSFICVLQKNKKIKFQVSGISNEIRHNYKKTHPIQTIITFKHYGFTSYGVPRHPSYKRIYCGS